MIPNDFFGFRREQLNPFRQSASTRQFFINTEQFIVSFFDVEASLPSVHLLLLAKIESELALLLTFLTTSFWCALFNKPPSYHQFPPSSNLYNTCSLFFILDTPGVKCIVFAVDIIAFSRPPILCSLQNSIRHWSTLHPSLFLYFSVCLSVCLFVSLLKNLLGWSSLSVLLIWLTPSEHVVTLSSPSLFKLNTFFFPMVSGCVNV